MKDINLSSGGGGRRLCVRQSGRELLEADIISIGSTSEIICPGAGTMPATRSSCWIRARAFRRITALESVGKAAGSTDRNAVKPVLMDLHRASDKDF